MKKAWEKSSEVEVLDLKEKIEFCEKLRDKLKYNLDNIENEFIGKRISERQYDLLITESKNGRTAREWVEYYNWYIVECKKRIDSIKKKERNRTVTKFVGFLFVPLLLVFLLGLIFYGVSEKEEIFLEPPSQEYIEDINLIFYDNQIYKWTPENSGELLSLKITGEIVGKGDVKIYLGDILILDSDNLEVSGSVITGFQVFDPEEGGDSDPGQRNETNFTLPGNETSGLDNTKIRNESEGNETPPGNETNFTVEIPVKEFSDYCEDTCDLSGLRLDQEDYDIVIVNNGVELKLENIIYEIKGISVEVPPGIEKREENTNRGKKIFVSGPDDATDVEVSVVIPESWNIKNPEHLRVYWIEEDSFVDFVSDDLDGDGIYDSINWNVPHFSNQTFEIIVITKAEHLDVDRNFISDIFEEVRELDDVWSESIPNRDYVRVAFEIPLDNSRDITIYPRTVNGNPRIEVYEVNRTEVIAEFDTIIDGEYNTILLTSLIGEQDTFDLKVIGGAVEFDHIIDPIAIGSPSSNGQINLEWFRSINAYSSDDNNAEDRMNQANRNDQDYYNFGYAIPAGATVYGIEVSVEGAMKNVAQGRGHLDVQLVKGGGLIGNIYATPTWATTTDVTYTVGGPTDLWGTTWTPSEINDINFGAHFSGVIDSGLDPRLRVDHIFTTVYYNSLPTIVSVDSIANIDLDPYDPILNPTGLTTITFSFVALDTDGVNDLDDSTATATFSYNGNDRTDVVCDDQPPIISGNEKTYFCAIDMNYYDEEGDWSISVNVEDNEGEIASDNSNLVHVNLLRDVSLTAGTPISFGSVNPGTQITASDTTIRNNGNFEGNVRITAMDLSGPQALAASNFWAADSATVDICTNGNQLQDSTPIVITSSNLPRGALGSNSEDIAVCFNIPLGLQPGAYSASGGNAWTIGILASVLAIRSKKKNRKKRQKKKEDYLLKAVGLMSDELRERYSLSKKETIGLIVDELRKKYKVGKKEIVESLDRSKEVPVSIFKKKLGGLEAISKYMKENLQMNYHEIAKELKRDDRTIWTAYNKAKKKDKKAFEIKEGDVTVLLEVFKNRKLTILESIVISLKKKGLKQSEIAKLLERDPRNVQTIYSRAVRKIGRKV